MAFADDGDDGSRRKSNIIKIVVGVVALVVIGLAIKYFVTGTLFGPEPPGARIDRELRADPLGGEAATAIREAYPDEYAAFTERLATMPRDIGSEFNLQAQASDFTKQLMINHYGGLARAPSDQLVEIARQYASLVGTLQRRDVALCGQYLTMGFIAGLRPPPEVVPIMSRITILQIRAARAGETQPSAAPRGALTPEDQAALLAEINRRSPQSGALLSQPLGLMGAPADQQCAAGLAMYQAISALPPETAAKVMVSLLGDTFGPQRQR